MFGFLQYIENSEREDLRGLTFDADSFDNARTYRDSYNIPDEEKLLVYANGTRCTNALEGSGTFITDEAIYIHPAKKSWADDSRIPLSNICDFVIYENKNSEVRLLSGQKELQIFAAIGRRRSSAAGDLVRLLHNLQDSLMSDPDMKRTYEKTVGGIYCILRRELRKEGILSEDYLSVLNVLKGFSYFKREAILLELESEYRHCNRASYERLLTERARDLNEDTIRVLKTPDELFFDAFISDLSGKGTFRNVKAIIDAYLRFKAASRFSRREAIILCYLCVRMEDYEFLDSLLGELGNDLSEDELFNLMAFKARFRNHKIHKIQSRIAGGDELTQEEILRVNDIGLSSLHYIMILRNKDLLKRSLFLTDWTKLSTPFPKDRIADAMFDPMFLASYIYRDEELLREIFAAVSPKAISIRRSIRSINSMIDINESLKDKYPDQWSFYNGRVEEYRQVKKDLKEELKRLAKAEVKRQRKLASIIKDAKHPLCEYLFWLFNSHHNLLNWISSTKENFRLCRYKDAFFVTKSGLDTELSFYEWQGDKIIHRNLKDSDRKYSANKATSQSFEREGFSYENPIYRAAEEARKRLEAEERERKRREFKEHVENPAPYAGSWFSEAAHSSLKALKEEYRILVKKYHPDSSKDDRTGNILMRIMNERADILESLKAMG